MTTKWTLSFGGDSGGTIYLNANDTPVTGSTTNYLITGVSGTLNGVALTSLVTVGQKLMTSYTIKNQVKTGGLPSYLGVKDAAGNSYLIHAGSDGTVSFVKENDVINFYKTYSAPTVTQSDPFVTGTTGNDTLTGFDNLNDSIQGYAGNDSISGLALNDTLEGGEGNDTIDGGEGADTVYGGLGNDLIYAGTGNDTLYGDAGYDTAQFSGTYDDYSFDYHEFVSGDGGLPTQQFLNVTFNRNVSNAALIDTGRDYLKNIEYLSFRSSYAANTSSTYALYQGSLRGDAFEGSSGQDLMFTGEGNDFLDGKAGVDILNGGSGNDTYYIDNVGDRIEDASGTDTVNSTVSYTLSAALEHLTLTGTAKVDATGNASANNLVGNSGDNIITGGAGNDTIDGGAGNDTLKLSWASTDFVEGFSYTATTSTFTVRAGEEVDTFKNIEKVYFEEDAVSIGVVGGTTGNDSLVGASTGDYMVGDAGNDTLSGAAGTDRMIGGAGNDLYVVDVYSDSAEEYEGGGTDTVQASCGYLLASNVENLTLTGTGNNYATGNSLANVIVGNSGGNLIDGGTGNDNINAGGGNDTITAGAGNDTIYGGDGTDTIRFSGMVSDYRISYDSNYGFIYTTSNSEANNGFDIIRSDVEKLSFRSAWSGNVTTLTYNVIKSGVAQGKFTGTSSTDAIFTFQGNDTLDGGAGADILFGGNGGDTYYVDDVNDKVFEDDWYQSAKDTVISSASYSLSNNVENLTLAGTAAINATGNTLANELMGNTGNNSISGEDGNDTILGGGGKDTLAGGSGSDTFRFTATTDSSTAQNDIITDFVTRTDKIDLLAIDANTSVASDQAFTYIGAASFSAAGQLRLIDNVLYGDVNGDKVADFQIALTGVTSLESTDFVL